MTTFAKRLTAWRDARQWSNAALAQFLAQKVGRDISVRTVETWVQGRKPHLIWRAELEKAIQ